jgi:hydrogenase/urease accessory protein HupE
MPTFDAAPRRLPWPAVALLIGLIALLLGFVRPWGVVFGD